MSRPVRSIFPSWPERIRAEFGQRAAAIVLTLLFEGLLALLLLTLAPLIEPHEETAVTVFNLDARPAPEQAADPPETKVEEAPAVKQPPQSEQEPPQPVEPQPVPPDPPLIKLSRAQMASAEIGAISPRPLPPSAAREPMMGPPDTGTPGDTQRVGGQGHMASRSMRRHGIANPMMTSCAGTCLLRAGRDGV